MANARGGGRAPFTSFAGAKDVISRGGTLTSNANGCESPGVALHDTSLQTCVVLLPAGKQILVGPCSVGTYLRVGTLGTYTSSFLA